MRSPISILLQIVFDYSTDSSILNCNLLSITVDPALMDAFYLTRFVGVCCDLLKTGKRVCEDPSGVLAGFLKVIAIKKGQRRKLLCPKWWAMRDSNPRPSRCKRDALNQLS